MDTAAKKEWLVVALVVAGLVTAEVTLTVLQNTLSGDVRQLNEAEEVVESVMDRDGLRVVLIGNSLLLAGVFPETAEEAVEASLGREVSLATVPADGTGSLEWGYMMRKLIYNQDHRPDLVVVAFGDGNLSDRSPQFAVQRLAAHHVDGPDVAFLLREDLTDIEYRSRFLLARASRAFALRDRIAPRVFDRVIPRYRELAPILLGPVADQRVEDYGLTRSFVYLERLLQDNAEYGIPLMAMPMPLPDPYDLHPTELELLTDFDIPILPTNVDHGLEADRFPDLLHLDEAGGQRFSQLLGPILARAIEAAGL